MTWVEVMCCTALRPLIIKPLHDCNSSLVSAGNNQVVMCIASNCKLLIPTILLKPGILNHH